MLDEIRNHDPEPTTEERDWMNSDLAELFAIVLAAALVTLGLGVAELWHKGAEALEATEAGTTPVNASSVDSSRAS